MWDVLSVYGCLSDKSLDEKCLDTHIYTKLVRAALFAGKFRKKVIRFNVWPPERMMGNINKY